MAPLISGCILLLTLGCCVFGQNHNTLPTPDDLCRTDHPYVDDHIYPDDWHLIVDSYDYEDLFGSSRAVWERRDVDGDRRGWHDAVGETCQLEIGVRSCTPPINQDNWFFTSYNSYNKSIEVILRATFRWSGCQRSGRCDKVSVYRYDTNGPVSEAMQTDPMNYMALTGDEMTSRLHHTDFGDTKVQLIFNRFQNFSGFYLGFRDIGACGGQIKRFLAYYRIAPPVNDGLLSCSEVPLVKDGSSSANCSCPAHASAVKTEDLTRTCDEEGTCSDLAVCECDCGYHESSDSRKCDACGHGFYRTNPASECTRCPPNTKDDQLQACQCECLPGYFRAKDEGPDDGCTPPPGACTELEALYVQSNYAVLRWKRPDGLGSEKLWYTIKRSDQCNIGDFEVIIERLESDEEYIIHNFTDLTPATSYVFRVVVHNKVTDMDEKNEHLRLCDVKLTTLEGVPGPPRVVRAYCSEVVWGPPFDPNGEVMGYDLEFYDYQDYSKTSTIFKEGEEHSTHIVDMDNDLPQDTESSQVYIKVRAKTLAHNGEWSEGRPLGCPLCMSPVQCPFGSCPLTPTPDVECAILVDPENGEVEQRGNSAVGSTAMYICDSQYQLVGDEQRICQPDGTWSGNDPSCVATEILCKELSPPRNGEVALSGRTVGSSATYTCDSGYQLIGEGNRVCQPDGTWSGSPPSCQARCGALLSPECGTVSQTGVTFGNTATYSCDPECVLVGSSFRFCTPNGEWSGKAPRCVRTCEDLPNPPNGTVTITRVGSPGIQPGSQARYRCNEGYELKGNSLRDCQPDGTWRGGVPTCCPVDLCDDLEDPENGKVTVLNRLAIYQCDPFYELSGNGSRFCVNGEWTGVAPTCEPSQVWFELNGKMYANNSEIQVSSIGINHNCLRCVTNKTDCCGTPNRAGEYFYPDGTTTVRTRGSGDDLYRGRGEQHICLHRRGNDFPLGVYCCRIPDSNDEQQNICINFV